MATGERAFPGDSQASIIAVDPEPHARRRPRRGSRSRPAALDHIVARALAKDPEERWQTARDVLLELRTRRGEPASCRPQLAGAAHRVAARGSRACWRIAGSGLLTNFLRRTSAGAGRRPRA